MRKTQFCTIQGGKIFDCIEKWPVLRHPMGWKLIKQDFENWEFCTVQDAISQWPQFFCRLLQVCSASDKKKLTRVNEILNILSKDLEDGNYQIYKLYL